MKAALRAQLRSARRALPAAARRRAAVQAARNASRLLRHRRHVAVYFSTGGELDTGPLIRALLRNRHRLFLPRLRGDGMEFVRYRAGGPLRFNRFGIAEPLAAARATRLDAVVMPLLGFDAAGRRLGQGGGFYDRALAGCRALRVGFAFAVQERSALPAEAHDLPLHAVVTERGVRKFRETGATRPT